LQSALALQTNMPDQFSDQIQRALSVLETDRKGLTRMLEVSMATLRSWEVRSPPAYAWLAVAALIASLGTKRLTDPANQNTRHASDRFSLDRGSDKGRFS